MKYLYDFGLNDGDIETLKTNASDEVYSDLSFFAKLVEKNLNYLKDFGVTNYKDIVLKYPEIFIRDEESFVNIFTKFDKDDLINKVTKNPAVIKKMVDFVDNN